MEIKLGVDYLERIRSNGSRVNLDDILDILNRCSDENNYCSGCEYSKKCTRFYDEFVSKIKIKEINW